MRIRTLLAATVFLLSGCSVQPPSIPLSEGESSARWQRFQELAPSVQPFRLAGSLRFGKPDDTNRVTYLIWSNGNLPVRADLQAGMGAIAAQIQENPSGILIYTPSDNKAYLTDNKSGLRRLGLPLPFSVAQMADFLEGRYYNALQQPQVTGASVVTGSDILYPVEAEDFQGSLTLSADGRPLSMKLDDWDISIRYENSLPYRLEAQQEDYRLILLVKERTGVGAYTDSELELVLPAEAAAFWVKD